MKADEQKINFGKKISNKFFLNSILKTILMLIFYLTNLDLSDMGCMSPLYATPPISPGSDNGPNFEDQFETPSAIFSAHNMENNDHFARDTHMRIILGNNKETSQQSK